MERFIGLSMVIQSQWQCWDQTVGFQGSCGYSSQILKMGFSSSVSSSL